MNDESLKKLSGILWAKWHNVIEEHGRERAYLKWRILCNSLGMELTDEIEEDYYETHGAVFEDSVVVNDPALYFTWIQMPKETALKILTIGMPCSEQTELLK